MRGQKNSKIGEKFERLTVIEYLGRSKWKCICDCGTITEAWTSDLTRGKKQSCGCLHKEQLRERLTTHGLRNTQLYKRWQHIKMRCLNENDAEFRNYGGRGITICDEWRNDFKAFYDWSMNNGYCDDLTIDRIDVNGNYEPSNCRWVDWQEQANNQRKNIYMTYNGKRQTVAQWARELNINPRTLHKRLKRGWSVERTLSK